MTCACGCHYGLTPPSKTYDAMNEKAGIELVAGAAVQISGCPACGHRDFMQPMSVSRIKEGAA